VASSLTERPKRLTSLVYRKTTAIERLVDHLQTARGGGLFDIRGFITREVLRDDDNDTSHEEKGRRQNKNKRSGFDMVDIADGTVLSLARRVSRGRHNNMMKKYGGVGTMPPYRTGRFAVDIDTIHRIAVPAIRSVMMADDDNDDSDDDDVDSADVEVAATAAAKGSNRQQNDNDDTITTTTTKVLILDEIGHMELHSIQFRNAVQQLFHVHHHRLLLSSPSSSSSSSDHNSLRVICSIPKPGAIPWCDELCRHHESFLRVYDLNRVDRDATVADVIREIDEEWIFDPTATTTPS
jgi:nucleoside-triphosphatase THEP1